MIKQKEIDLNWEKIKQITGEISKKIPSSNFLETIQNFYNKKKTTKKEVNLLRQMKILELRKSMANKELILAKRQRDPSLSLFVGYDIDNSERFSSTINRSGAVVGLNLLVPFWNTQAIASKKNALLNLSKSELNLYSIKRSLEVESNQISVKIHELNQKRKLIKEKIEISKRILKEEKRRYNYGRIQLDDLIELETNFLRYKYQEQTEDLEYGKAILQWLSLKDNLLLLRETL